MISVNNEKAKEGLECAAPDPIPLVRKFFIQRFNPDPPHVTHFHLHRTHTQTCDARVRVAQGHNRPTVYAARTRDYSLARSLGL